MLAFSIIMWFCSIVLCFFAVRLIIGDASPVQGKKEYETLIENKTGYVKSIGRLCLFISAGLFASGFAAMAGKPGHGIFYALGVIIATLAAAIYYYYKILHKYSKKQIQEK